MGPQRVRYDWETELNWETHFLFLGSKITVDGAYSHEIRKYLLLGRKTMTNLDSVFKSNDIAPATKVHIVKAIVFLVVMYGCKRRTIKKIACQRIDTFKLWCSTRLLRVPWTARRSDQLILREINPEYSLKGLVLKLKRQCSGHLMWRADSLQKSPMLGKIEHRRRRGWQRMRWLDSITDAVDVKLGKFQVMVRDREAWRASVHGVTRVGPDWATKQQQLQALGTGSHGALCRGHHCSVCTTHSLLSIVPLFLWWFPLLIPVLCFHNHRAVSTTQGQLEFFPRISLKLSWGNGCGFSVWSETQFQPCCLPWIRENETNT